MVVVRGRLDPEVGALLMRAVEAASDALYRDEARRERERERAAGELDEATPEQRRADAVGLLAERALAAGFGEVARGEEESAPLPAVTSGTTPIGGSRAERYMVMLHVDGATLSEDTEPGLSGLDDGTRVSAETSRRLACDCGVVKIHKGPDGQVQGAGRRVRTVNPALRRGLEARDRGCRFPGCGLRFAEAHHVKHWADGGETSLQNLVLLCRKHHRAVHEGGVTVCIDVNGQAVFFTRKGKALMGAPPRRLPPRKRPGTKGLELPAIRDWAGTPDYKYDRDIPWEVEARALEVVDPK